MDIYGKFKRLGLDCACFGLEASGGDCDYFCAPRGFEPLFELGVDGICFGFIHGFGETVFALSPMNLPGDYVHPVSRSFGDFLRVLLACGADAAEQAHGWGLSEFEAFLQEQDPPERERAAERRALARKLGIEPMERPFEYIKKLQAEFDYTRLKFKSHEYPADAGEAHTQRESWQVCFPSEGERSTRPGREVPVNASFSWGGYDWLVPAVYVCARGLVVDFCRAVPAERERAFLEKWRRFEHSELGEADRERAEAENPLVFNFSAELTVNGKTLRPRSGTGSSFVPPDCGAEWPGGTEEKRWMEHYCLDTGSAWALWRKCFPWETKRAPARLGRAALCLRQDPVAVPGEEFTLSGVGDEAVLTHPVTGARHVLRVLEYERQSLPETVFTDRDWDYPAHYTAIQCELTPPLRRGELALRDCGEGDRPRRRTVPEARFAPESAAAASVGIIGGADGPAAFCLAGGRDAQSITACSALSFVPREAARWRAVFYIRFFGDTNLELDLSGTGN